MKNSELNLLLENLYGKDFTLIINNLINVEKGLNLEDYIPEWIKNALLEMNLIVHDNFFEKEIEADKILIKSLLFNIVAGIKKTQHKMSLLL